MRVNSFTIDDFYANPMEVREFALKQEFKNLMPIAITVFIFNLFLIFQHIKLK